MTAQIRENAYRNRYIGTYLAKTPAIAESRDNHSLALADKVYSEVTKYINNPVSNISNYPYT